MKILRDKFSQDKLKNNTIISSPLKIQIIRNVDPIILLRSLQTDYWVTIKLSNLQRN
jgi:hypothetical protein